MDNLGIVCQKVLSPARSTIEYGKEDDATNTLTLSNRRIVIAGSASRSTDPELIRYAHRLVSLLTEGLLSRGGRAIVGTGKEPLHSDEADAPALLFDWTVLATSDRVLSAHGQSSALSGPSLTCLRDY